MDIADIEIKAEGRFALLGFKAEDHAEDDFSNANADLSQKDQQNAQYDTLGYVDTKEEGNIIARAGGFTREVDGKDVTYFVVGWRDSEKEKEARNEPKKQAISKRDV